MFLLRQMNAFEPLFKIAFFSKFYLFTFAKFEIISYE